MDCRCHLPLSALAAQSPQRQEGKGGSHRRQTILDARQGGQDEGLGRHVLVAHEEAEDLHGQREDAHGLAVREEAEDPRVPAVHEEAGDRHVAVVHEVEALRGQKEGGDHGLAAHAKVEVHHLVVHGEGEAFHGQREGGARGLAVRGDGDGPACHDEEVAGHDGEAAGSSNEVGDASADGGMAGVGAGAYCFHGCGFHGEAGNGASCHDLPFHVHEGANDQIPVHH